MRAVALLVFLGAVSPGAGCGRCLVGNASSGRQCDASGSATLTAAPGLSSSKPLYVWMGLSCFSGVGCNPGLWFVVHDTQGDTGMAGFEFDVSLPPQYGSYTATDLPASGNWVPNGSSTGFESLTFVSSSVAVSNASEAGFSATFTFDFQTRDGQPVTVSSGQATISNCRTITSCGE